MSRSRIAASLPEEKPDSSDQSTPFKAFDLVSDVPRCLFQVFDRWTLFARAPNILDGVPAVEIHVPHHINALHTGRVIRVVFRVIHGIGNLGCPNEPAGIVKQLVAFQPASICWGDGVTALVAFRQPLYRWCWQIA
jgi:hypothetical protein